jgi:hypothetical protein
VTTPAKSELDAARKKLKTELQRFKECYKFDPEHADVRLMLDALKEAERVADAGKRHFDGQYRPWPQAGGPKDRQCQHGVDRERFDCEGCDAQVLSAWRKQQ